MTGSWYGYTGNVDRKGSEVDSGGSGREVLYGNGSWEIWEIYLGGCF